MAGQVRWGILGAANIAAGQFIPAVAASRRGVLEAVAARDPERAAPYAAKHGIARVVSDYAALIADPGIDAVYIALPNGLHAQWTIAAARAGKHVLCEKPWAVDAREARASALACAEAGVIALESFVYKAHPQTLRVGRWLAEGAIGEVRTAYATFHFTMTGSRRQTDIRMSQPLVGGAMMDVGCYPISFLRFVFGEEPLAVAAQGIIDPQQHVDTQVTGLLHFSRGRGATFSCSFDTNTPLLARITGTTGEIVVTAPYHPRGAGATITLRRNGQPDEVVAEARDEPPFLAAVEHFCDCVLDGASPLWTTGDAVANMAAIDAVLASVRSGGTRVPVAPA